MTEEKHSVTMSLSASERLKLAVSLIPEFSGNRKEFHRFVASCESIIGNIEDEVEAKNICIVIQNKIKGTAYEIIKNRKIETWGTIKNLLQKHFLETKTVGQLQAELFNMKQRPNEKVKSFATRVENTLKDLNDASMYDLGTSQFSTVNTMNTKLASNTFKMGLVEPIRTYIRCSRLTGLAELINEALSEERLNTLEEFKYPSYLENKRKQFGQFPDRQAQFYVPQHNTGRNIKYNHYQDNEGQSRPNQFNRQDNFNQHRQDNFNQYRQDHFNQHRQGNFSQNRQNNSNYNPNRQSLPQYNIRTVKISCSYCKKSGHDISTCYNRPQSRINNSAANKGPFRQNNNYGSNNNGHSSGNGQWAVHASAEDSPAHQ